MKRTLPYILLADDDADDRFLMELCFADIGWSEQVEIVESGDEVLDYLKYLSMPFLPSLIVLDFNMLKQTGEEILRQLKNHQLHKSIPVVIYSTSMSSGLSHRLNALGAESCHVKPDRYDRILALAKTFRELAENKMEETNTVFKSDNA